MRGVVACHDCQQRFEQDYLTQFNLAPKTITPYLIDVCDSCRFEREKSMAVYFTENVAKTASAFNPESRTNNAEIRKLLNEYYESLAATTNIFADLFLKLKEPAFQSAEPYALNPEDFQEVAA